MKDYKNRWETKLGKTTFLIKGLERLEKSLDFAEVYEYASAYDDLDIYEDDGSLHVSAYKKRYCVYIGQDVSMREYKAEAKRALKALEITGYKVQGS